MLDSELSDLGSPWDTEEFTKDLHQHYKKIESWVNVSSSPYGEQLLNQIGHDAHKLDWCDATPIFSKWIPFRRRNLGHAWMRLLKKSKRVSVLLNLQPIEWIFDDTGDDKTIRTVKCCSKNGHTVNIFAKHYVIAAGGLESPLILEKMLGKESARKLGVGQSLHDHLSLRSAEIINYNRAEFEKLFSPFFTGETMRSMRLCMPDKGHQNSGNSNWAYCHFVVEPPRNSGFSVARDFLRGIQAKSYKSASKALLKSPSAIGDIARMMWLRYTKKLLSISKGSRIFVNIDFVQTPSKNNTINFVSQINSDQIEIDWNICDDINGHVERSLQLLNIFWKKNGLRTIGEIKPIGVGIGNTDAINNLYDIYHPAGTCAMGRVVDSNMKIYGLQNGYVVGSSVFPKLGRSNPTFTIMAMSLRLSQHLLSLMRP